MSQFNFFKILEKDDKELIHSAFISYLLDNNIDFRKKFIHEKIDEFQISELEKSYRLEKLKVRIDIELKSIDGSFVTFIENKFKSFPTENQLKNYDKVFKKKFDKSTELKKILFCFDKNIVNFKTDWKILDYKDLLEFLKENYTSKSKDDESIFVKHYTLFLEEYIETYKNLKLKCNQLFNKQLTKDEKFWVRLLNSQIALEFEREFSTQNFEFHINPGNTAVPLLNILPKHWKEKTKEELLIQFQGNDLKFYLHSKNKENAEKIIRFSEGKIWKEKYEVKKLTERNQNSCFIFKTKLTENLNNDFTYKELYELIVDFYVKIDEKIIQNYS
jgi:hypothetical protein